MVSGKMNRWVQYLLFPLMGFFLYILLGVFCPAMVSDVIFGNGLVYALAVAIFGVWAFRHRQDGVPDKPVKFSLFGWLVILTVFIMMYLTAEGIGNYLYQLYPVGSSDVYANMKGSELTMYLLFGCTIGPIAEELVFRRVLFRQFRHIMPFWVAVLISGSLFTLIHGTVMHIPVTVGLSVFLCVMYEVTGQFRMCIIFHILFNWLATVYLVAISITPPVMIGWYVVVLISMVLAYQFRHKVFDVWFQIGGGMKLEAYLDAKRKAFSEGQNDDQNDGQK